MKNKTTGSRCILSVLLVCFLCIGGIAHAQSIPELEQAMEDAEDLVDETQTIYEDANAHINAQIANFVRLHGHLVSIEMPGFAPTTNTQSLIVKLTKIVEKLIQSTLLTSTMEEQLTAIETQRETCNTLWTDFFGF